MPGPCSLAAPPPSLPTFVPDRSPVRPRAETTVPCARRLQEEAFQAREDPIREALSLRFRTNAEQAGVGLDMKASGEGALCLLCSVPRATCRPARLEARKGCGRCARR